MTIPDNILQGLREHQKPLAQTLFNILGTYRSGVDLSVTGSGKTYVGAAVSCALKQPTLIVCPKSIRSAWGRAFKHFSESVSTVGYEMLRTGNTPYGKWANEDRKPRRYFKCQCCQQVVDFEKYTPCYCHPKGIHCIEEHKKSVPWGKFSFHPAVKHVIFDEVHRCSGDSFNSDMLMAAKRQKLSVIAMSATAACSPLKMRGLGYLLDLHGGDQDVFMANRRLPNFYSWARRYGVRNDPRFGGLKWMVGRDRQLEIMREIREMILPQRGVRVHWDDIPGFPAIDIQAELYDLDDPEAVDSCYKEMAEATAALELKAANDKAPESKLRILLRGRQKVELLKVPVFTELAEDYLEKGMSVVFFVNFTQTIEELKKRFPDFGVIDGNTPGRDETLEKFQTNESPGLIVNNAAGSESLSMQDLDGFHPRVGLVSPTFSAETMRQLFGRLRRDGGKSPAIYRVLFANKTVEMEVHRNVTPKLNNIDALNDGDFEPQNLRLK